MKILNFIKKEPVLIIAVLLALISVCVIRPAGEVVVHSIDLRTLSLLFCLMIIIKAFQSINLLDWIAAKLLQFCKNLRILYIVLTFVVFFISMIVTNDVALLTFVPLTILVCNQAGIPALLIIVLETLAANLGSCITPMGNPQNLFLFSYYGFTAGEFFINTLKIGIPSAVILLSIILVKTGKTNSIKIQGNALQNQKVNVIINWRILIYTADLIISLLTVFHLIDYRITLIITIISILICNFRLYKSVDYCLLLTFTGFFIFTGTISTVESFSNFLANILNSEFKTYVTGILSSQIISNVPAALLLSGFTKNGKELLLAVNVGGLGTIIASLASVISYKLYSVSDEGKSEKGKGYFLQFTLYNFVILVILSVIVWFLSRLK